jgi:hypothetical protein
MRSSPRQTQGSGSLLVARLQPLALDRNFDLEVHVSGEVAKNRATAQFVDFAAVFQAPRLAWRSSTPT